MNKNPSSFRISTSIKFLLIFFLLAACHQSEPKADETEPQIKKQAKPLSINEVEKESDQSEYPKLDSDQAAEEFLRNYVPRSESNRIKVSTELGELVIELYTNTQVHRMNMLYLTDRQYFDGTWFHRVSAGHVAQAGNNDEQDLVQLQ